MDLAIKNIDDLRLEIYRLKGLEEEQRFSLKQRFSSFSSIFSTILSLFPRGQSEEGTKSDGIFGLDIVQLISGIVLPFTLNKTLFRKSNFVTKALVRYISTRASKFINESSVGQLWSKLKPLFPGKTAAETMVQNINTPVV